VNIGNLREEQLVALDELVNLLDEAAILIRADKLDEANLKIQEARKRANRIRAAAPK
jgi:hypothetical protein